MFERGMSYEEVMAMIERMGWEILEEEHEEEDGEEWTVVTVWQEDHAVALGIDEGGVYEMQFIPRWAL